MGQSNCLSMIFQLIFSRTRTHSSIEQVIYITSNRSTNILLNVLKIDLISSSYIIQSNNDYSQRNSNEFILSIDYFDLILPNYLLNDSNTNQYSPFRNTIAANNELNKPHPNTPVNNDPIKPITTIVSTEQINLIKKSKLLRTNDSFRSFLYVYPKSLKYDQQKMFSKARNILIKTELRENDSNSADETSCLKSILNLNKNFLTNNEENIFATNHLTQITHHNKTPQFYDEIKILLPMNLNEKHHLLFKFYHVSCSNAKSITAIKSDEIAIINESINSNYSKSVETLIGYAWLPIFKNGRLINGEKQLPVAQTITGSYLTFEQTGFGQSVGPNDIKWIDGMKPLFKFNLVPLSTIHTTDPHVANFYNQSEKLINSLRLIDLKNVPSSIGKKRAPLIDSTINETKSSSIPSSITNKEIINNSIKVILIFLDKNNEIQLIIFRWIR